MFDLKVYISDIPEDHNKTDPKPTKKPDNELVAAGNENSMAILTAFIGCFIGIILTSFIFLCCNPCHQLMKKRERHFSERVSFYFLLSVTTDKKVNLINLKYLNICCTNRIM